MVGHGQAGGVFGGDGQRDTVEGGDPGLAQRGVWVQAGTAKGRGDGDEVRGEGTGLQDRPKTAAGRVLPRSGSFLGADVVGRRSRVRTAQPHRRLISATKTPRFGNSSAWNGHLGPRGSSGPTNSTSAQMRQRPPRAAGADAIGAAQTFPSGPQ